MFAAEKRHLAPKWLVFPDGLPELVLGAGFPFSWVLDEADLPKMYHHLSRVARAKVGEQFMLVDADVKKRYLAIIQSIEKRKIIFDVLSCETVNLKPQQNITAYCAVIKPERFEWMLEKLVELGLGAIQPIITQFTQGQYVEKLKQPKYQTRLQDIIVQTAQQCEQDSLPKLFTPIQLVDIPICNEDHVGFVLTERGGGNGFTHSLSLQAKSAIINKADFVVGPEGGWSQEEITCLVAKKYNQVTISGNVLRAETASIYAACILSEWFCFEQS